jgi:polysaccharide biosynthesis/export protein
MLMTKLRRIVACSLLLGAGTYGLSLAASQADGSRRGQAATAHRAGAARSKAQPPVHPMAQYLVEPPDVLVVEVLEALPGRPVSGEHLVRLDGKISLGFYGDLFVSGMTLREVKTKLIRHLQKYLPDEQLGLNQGTKETGERVVDRPSGTPTTIDPSESDKVFVGIAKSNSKHYYIHGAVAIPGRANITGLETVLDAIHVAGGLAADADHNQVFLYRKDVDGAPVQRLKIDIDQIMMGDDLSTNYQIGPGDRLVVRRRAAEPAAAEGTEPQPAEPIGSRPSAGGQSSTGRHTSDNSAQAAAIDDEAEAVKLFEKRLGELERKLNLILEAIKFPQR